MLATVDAPPLVLVLRREQHPEDHEQLAVEFHSSHNRGATTTPS